MHDKREKTEEQEGEWTHDKRSENSSILLLHNKAYRYTLAAAWNFLNRWSLTKILLASFNLKLIGAPFLEARVCGKKVREANLIYFEFQRSSHLIT